MDEDNLVFISYARENTDIAERLYMNLRENHINAWLDSKNLKPGANWKYEIKKSIKNARYFILLISKYSIGQRGFVQKEIREALDVLQEFPKNQIFIIPVRLDDTQPIDEELLELNWIDLYKDYYSGLESILRSLTDLLPAPLVISSNEDNQEMKVLKVDSKVLHKGEWIDTSKILMVGETRGAINYTPFRTLNEYFMQFIDRMPPSSIFSDKSISYYFTLDTTKPNLILGDDLITKYPKAITIVLHNSYSNLKAYEAYFAVEVSFNINKRVIKIPYDSIMRIEVPEIGLLIQTN